MEDKTDSTTTREKQNLLRRSACSIEEARDTQAPHLSRTATTTTTPIHNTSHAPATAAPPTAGKKQTIDTPTCLHASYAKVEAPVLNRKQSYPSPLGLFLHTRDLFTSLPLADRSSMIPLLYAILDFERDEETYREYDKMTARELFRRFGVSKRCGECGAGTRKSFGRR